MSAKTFDDFLIKKFGVHYAKQVYHTYPWSQSNSEEAYNSGLDEGRKAEHERMMRFAKHIDDRGVTDAELEIEFKHWEEKYEGK